MFNFIKRIFLGESTEAPIVEDISTNETISFDAVCGRCSQPITNKLKTVNLNGVKQTYHRYCFKKIKKEVMATGTISSLA